MNAADGWIKMSDKKPSVFPVFAYYTDGEINMWSQMFVTGAEGCATHWMPATLPAPPKKELTQHDLDEIAVTEIWDAWWKASYACSMKQLIRQTLAYRDKQNAEDLEQMHSTMIGRVSFGYNSLRRRCGLDT